MFFPVLLTLGAMALAAQNKGDNVLTVPHDGHQLLARVTTLTSPTGPQQTGTIKTCNKWYTIVSGDTCTTVETAFKITHAQFLQWNPAVSSDCSQNFWLGDTYCVGDAAQSTPGAPTMTGIPCGCNKYYTIVSGDSCGSVETKFGITHAQFIQWNPAVSSDCATNFWLGEAYCVGVNTATNACSSTKSASVGPSSSTSSVSIIQTTNTNPYSAITGDVLATAGPRPSATGWPPSPTGAGTITNCIRYYQANPGDTCQAIVSHYSHLLNLDTFMAYNPSAGKTAESCKVYVNYYYCVDASFNSSQTQPSATTTIFPSWTPIDLPPMDTTSEVPQPTAPGAPLSCQSWYQAAAGDTCASVAANLGYLAASDIQSWNSGISCSSPLIASQYYCVANFGSAGNLPLPSTVATPPSPTQTGIISSCKAWYLATQGDSCDLIPQYFGTFDKSSLLSWNPALGGASCSGLVVGDYYCVAVPETPATRTIAVSSAGPTPTNGAGPQPEQPGIPADCTQYWLVSSADNCTTIAQANGITEQQLESWNPALGADCTRLLANYYICVKASSAGTTPPPASGSSTSKPGATTTAAPVSTPTPTQTGMASNCNRFYKVETGDGCLAIAQAANIALDTFYALNPAVKTDCSGLQGGVFVCLGTVADGAPATTIASGAPVPATPSPVQTGMAKGCTRFYLVRSGDGCSPIAASAGIALADFNSWNPAVGSTCGGLLAGDYVCIGLGSSGVAATTITSGPPVPAKTG